MGEYVNSSLRNGENVKHEAHLSLWSLASGFLTGGLVLLASVMTIYTLTSEELRMVSNVIAGLLVLAGFVILMQTLARYYTTELAVTNKRVIAKRGWISRSTIEMLLHKVESVQVLQTAFQRICGYGSIVISAAGEENALIKGISNPIGFRDSYYEAEENRQGHATDSESGYAERGTTESA